MRRSLNNHNFYKVINTERITKLVDMYEALCDVAYDPKCEHKCWTTFIKETGYTLNVDILQVKEKIDTQMERMCRFIDYSLDKNQND